MAHPLPAAVAGEKSPDGRRRASAVGPPRAALHLSTVGDLAPSGEKAGAGPGGAGSRIESREAQPRRADHESEERERLVAPARTVPDRAERLVADARSDADMPLRARDSEARLLPLVGGGEQAGVLGVRPSREWAGSPDSTTSTVADGATTRAPTIAASRNVAPPRTARTSDPPVAKQDMGRLADQVYRLIVDRLALERRRKGR